MAAALRRRLRSSKGRRRTHFAPASPPRGRDDPLVSRFTLIRYIITGGYVGVATVGAFIATYQSMGIPLKLLRTWGQCSNWGSDAVAGFSNACDAFDAGKGKLVASAVALTTLVVMEMLRALCAVSSSLSTDIAIERCCPTTDRYCDAHGPRHAAALRAPETWTQPSIESLS